MKTPHVLLLAVALLGGGLLFRPSRAQSFQARALLTPEQVEILSHMSLVNLDDGSGTPRRTLRITGLYVQIVFGEGGSETTDGLGHLLLG
jgi:hypothetical protein